MMDIITIPLVLPATIFFAIVAVFVIAMLGLSFYLVFSLIFQSYRYSKFELPVDKELIIGSDETEQKIVDPIEVTKFNISESSDDELISESRSMSKMMHEHEQKKLKEKKEQELKILKKELSKKGKAKK